MRKLISLSWLATPLLLLLALSACNTTGGGGDSAGAFSGESRYSMFWDQGDHLSELLDAKKFDAAAKLYAAETAFFSEKPNKYAAQLKILADHLNARHEPKLAGALGGMDSGSWPTPHAGWESISAKLRSAENALTAYNQQPVLTAPRFRSETAKRLSTRKQSLEVRIRRDASMQLASFDVFGERSFFELYPVKLEAESVMAAAWKSIQRRLDTASTEEIEKFASHYPKKMVGVKNWRAVGNTYVWSLLGKPQDGAKPDLTSVFNAVSKAHKAGFEPDRVPGIKIGFVEVTSQSLLKHGQVEFPAEVVVDFPVQVTKSDLGKALTRPAIDGVDYLVVFDVALAKTKRRISAKKAVRSKFVAGHRTQPNPAYALAQNAVNTAQIELQSASMRAASAGSQSCQGAGCLVSIFAAAIAGANKSSAQEKLNEAMMALQSTSMTVEVPVHKSYNYDLATVRSSKSMTVHYYVLDLKKRRYFKSTFDVGENKSFKVAYAVHPNDPGRSGIIESAETDKDVAAWEEAPSTVKLSTLVDHYMKERRASKPLSSLAALRKEMLADKNVALAKFEATRFDARPLNDPRFDSVVVVYSNTASGKSLGSGFFVTPDVVMTNFHVIDGATFVEMKMYDGQETFGKVVARDAIRDLAVVKVQRRGKPVRFFSGRTLDLGATVDAIGHPRGLEFSITRGVISAVRKQATVAIRGASGENVLFIQTDAPVNSGNSGGPLFLKDRVVGVNTQGQRKNVSEGLNFSVHFSEVIDFLKENVPSFKLRSDG